MPRFSALQKASPGHKSAATMLTALPQRCGMMSKGGALILVVRLEDAHGRQEQ
jgi:hypothetical protein